ncbi:hypothetical protein JCM5350_001924 [Sporobolomyces pararoseus]
MAETIFDREALLELPKSKLFKGKWFHIHGPMTGFTEGKLTRLIEKHGGKVSDKVIGNANVSHVVLSGQYWGKQGTQGADPLVKLILQANEENATESDSECNRTWLIKAEWVFTCLTKGKLVSERKYDFDIESREEKETKQLSRKEQLKKERLKNNGQSKFARGERVKFEHEQKLKREEAEAARLAAMDVDPQEAKDGFSGLNVLKKPKQEEKGEGDGSSSTAMQIDSDHGGKGKGKERSLKHFGFGKGGKEDKEKEKSTSAYRKPLVDSDDSDDPSPKPSVKKPSSSSSSKSKSEPKSKPSSLKSKAQAIELSDTSDESSLIISSKKIKTKKPSSSNKTRPPSSETEAESSASSSSEEEPLKKKTSTEKGTASRLSNKPDSKGALSNKDKNRLTSKTKLKPTIKKKEKQPASEEEDSDELMSNKSKEEKPKQEIKKKKKTIIISDSEDED